MVYVLDSYGQPLMPTERHGKVRILLKTKRAKVIQRCPFTIQLLYPTTDYVEDITLGIDAGSKHIGVSATTEKKELYVADVQLRDDIVKLLADRRELRRVRRNRKTRYRAPRFDKRRASKQKGWVAPSIRNKIETHLNVVKKVCKILPIHNIIVETASFDIQKIKNDAITGYDYQHGDQQGFWNVREYVLWRDGHTCQYCHGNSKDKVLNVHHIESRKTGGDAPNNLVALCETCHKAYHAGKIQLNVKRGHSFRHATFMGIMRWTFYNELKARYPRVSMTYGYLTKDKRITKGLEKEHYNDAYCIAGHLDAKPLDIYYLQKKVRCHNRQIHRLTVNKGGTRKRNQTPYKVKGYRLYDKIRYQGEECFIFGRRATGYFDIRHLNGEKVHAGISYK